MSERSALTASRIHVVIAVESSAAALA